MTLWINGDWITGQGASRVKRNPVSGEVLWQGNDADAAQVGQACRAARAAFPRWARLSLAERQVVVERFAGLLERNKGELTAIIARETGKPRWEAATEVTAMINKIAISIKRITFVPASSVVKCRTVRRACDIARTACWRCLGRIISLVICRTDISFRHCWQVTPLSLNPAN